MNTVLQQQGCITVYQPISGWKAVMLTPDADCGGDLTPWSTGMFAYGTKAEAVEEARSWAAAEGMLLSVDGKLITDIEQHEDGSYWCNLHNCSAYECPCAAAVAAG